LSKTKDSEAPRHAWRDNIEAITISIIMAVMLKYFVVEAYKIPTGSMQPTLMGNEETQIFDRILVDKLSYHFRDPERWEVAVFKYPLDRSKNFIKRIVGVGPEELRVRFGDVWNRPDANADWKVLRRTDPVQDETWKPLHLAAQGAKAWKLEAPSTSNWSTDGESLTAGGPGSARYPANGMVLDRYTDGYSLAVQSDIRKRPGIADNHPVGDLRLSGTLEARPELSLLTFEFREGSRRYQLNLPGPAASPDARPSIRAESLAERDLDLPEALNALFDRAWKLEAGDEVSFAAQNLDDLLTLTVDGETLLELEIPAASDQTSSIYVRCEGGGADLDELEVHRDIFYTSNHAKIAEWSGEWAIPAGHYVMLGDNTQDSSDSREWTLARFDWPGTDGVLRGNLRGQNENPRRVPGGEHGTELWFRDEWGELHHAPEASVQQSSPASVEAPFVPREQITGRAVLVFWPLKVGRRMWRLQWIR
jgi:signal peptidase I